MAGDAYDTIKRFWESQDEGDDAALSPLFADDARLVDPVDGTFVGGDRVDHGRVTYYQDDTNEVKG